MENEVYEQPKVLRKSVLVIDDNVLLLRTVKEMLSDQYNVAIATSCYQAFEQLELRKHDIILLDYEMPDVNGSETFHKLKNDKRYESIPVIFFTGSADKETVTKLLSLKPDGYMLKPPSKSKLVPLVEKVLSHKKIIDTVLETEGITAKKRATEKERERAIKK